MPELRFKRNGCSELTEGDWCDMNTEQKSNSVAFSGTRSLLLWCRQQTENYSEVNVINMTTSWRDGLAFCAIIHRFRPDLIDFDRLSKDNIMENNELAFSIAAKHFGIPMVLDASDIVENVIPDRLSVITYVSQLYEYFKNRTPANQGYATKMNIKPKARAEAKSRKASKRTSPSSQMYILSGHAKRVATALRNVFKSDTKEESSKGKESGHSSKYLGVDPTRTNQETARSTNEPSPNTARKSPLLGNDCYICHNRVYIMERLIAERKLFHRACFRCDKCNAYLRPGTYQYFPETDRFCCLFDCSGGHRETPIKIKLDPITDAAQGTHSKETSSSKTFTGDDPHSIDSPQQSKSSLQRQFSVVKRNAIHLNALPQSLSQGKGNITQSPKHLHSTTHPTELWHKGEGEKKRRLSGNGKTESRREGKGKHDQKKTSWSPVHKRRAPERISEDEKGDLVDSNLNVDAPRKTLKLTVPKDVLVSDREQKKVEKNEEEKLVHLRTREETRLSREESFCGAPTVNLFFSFKEELLKRATETKVEGINEGDKMAKENKLLVNGCANEMSQDEGKTTRDDDGNKEIHDPLGNGIDSGDDNLVIDNERKHPGEERKHSDDESVKSDSTTESGSRKVSILNEAEVPVVPKSVQKLREKFLNISDVIDEKHKTNIVKKSQEIQRELRCVSAWKQQTESHVATSRKLSSSMAGKSAELRKPNVGTNRRSVKELRKMYMGNGNSENKGSKEKLNMVRSRSMKAAVSTEQETSASETKEIPSQSSQGELEERTDSKELDVKEDSSALLGYVVNGAEKGPSKTCESQADSGVVVIVQIDNRLEKMESSVADGKELSTSLMSSNQIGNMSHDTRSYTIIKSEDVSKDVPSLQIQPASSEPANGERRSPGLKRHAASHDSGIDEPPYGQNNLLSSVPDSKILAESLKVAAEFSFPGSGGSVLPSSAQPSNEPVSDLQPSEIPLSPGSDFSPIEVSWSLPLSVGRRASLTDTSSSCSSPRMSVIIAQEASTTKINSRYFTVESMEPWDFEDYRIAEEHQCVMEVEGEFSFGREKSKTSRAEREAIFSLHRDAKNTGFDGTGLIKEDEITLSPAEIDAELQTLEEKNSFLERRGVEIEHHLRESMDYEGPYNDSEDELLREWLSVVHDRNKIMRRESELIYLLQSHNYEERYRTVEGELRKLVAMRDEVKSTDDLKRERELLSELLELVQKRSFIVDNLEEERGNPRR